MGGRGRSGGGRSWALHGEGRTTAGLGGGGASPATLGGRSRTEELRWGETKLVEGSIWGGTGRNGGSTELRRRPAMVAAALVSWARERLGSALYRQGRRGRSIWGRACWGERVLGEARTAVTARPAMVVAVASTGRVGGAWRALVAPGKSGFVKQGARGWFWAEARRVGRPGGFTGVRRRRRRGAGRRRLKNRPVAIS